MGQRTVQLVWGLCGGVVHAGAAAPAHALLAGGTWAAGAVPPPPCEAAVEALHLGWEHAVALDGDGATHVADAGALARAVAAGAPCHARAAWRSIWPCDGRPRVLQVSAGEAHCLLLDASGCVWALGSDRHGQLGLGAASEQERGADLASPARALGPGAGRGACSAPIACVAAGGHHSAAVCAARGRCFTWGCGSHGQLGHGGAGPEDGAAPALVRALDGVPLASLAAGLAHTVAASRDGAVYVWGCNCSGELGLGAAPAQQQAQQQVQQAQQGKRSPRRRRAAQVASPPPPPPAQRSPPGGGAWAPQLASALLPTLLEHPCLDEEHVVQVAAGSRHTVVLTASGSVYAWGLNNHGQCGGGATEEWWARGGGGAAAPAQLPMPSSVRWLPWFEMRIHALTVGRPRRVRAAAWLTVVEVDALRCVH